MLKSRFPVAPLKIMCLMLRHSAITEIQTASITAFHLQSLLLNITKINMYKNLRMHIQLAHGSLLAYAVFSDTGGSRS